MFSFLNSPYPPPDSGPLRALIVSVFLGVFVAIFLIVFKPFDTSGSSMPHLNLFLAGYGIVIALATFLPSLVLRLFLPASKREKKWTVGWQVVYLFFIVGLGISASYWYLLQAGGRANWADYFYFFRNGLLVASFPIVVITLLDYIRKLRYYESGAAHINNLRHAEPAVVNAKTETFHSTSTSLLNFTLTDSQGRSELTISSDKVWCLHSDGNYVEVWTIKPDGTYDRIIIRNTLSALTDQLPNQAGFINCHRSWIVNADLVENITGNAQGYHLHRAGAPTVVVARGRSQHVMQQLDK